MQLYLILCGLLSQSAAVKQDTGVISASVGRSVTLHCFYDSQVAMHFSWYRQELGRGPELLSNIYRYDEAAKALPWIEKNPRFSVLRGKGVNHLHISNVELSDSASYFCGSSHSNVVEFGDGVFLSVKGADLEEIIQEPALESVHPGDSVTLNCSLHPGTCGGEHSVYWFRQGSRHGILHTYHSTRSPSQRLIYHWQKLNLSSSDSGTYFCAVASCGQIVFGNGSQLIVKGDVQDQTQQMRILVLLSIVRTGVIVSVVTICFLVYISKSR